MMKRCFAILTVLVLLSGLSSAWAEAAPADPTARTAKITAHFAGVEEGQKLMRGRTLYHAQINESNLAFLLQKKGGTLEEYIDYAAGQVLPFEPEDEQRISGALDWLQGVLEAGGLSLPDPGTVTFVKTTGMEESGAAGYTSEGVIFLAQTVFAKYPERNFRLLVLHELSHCLSRLFPEYRKALYSQIHFRVLDKDIDIPREIMDVIVANPDVEHHNSTAVFTIGGKKTECYLVFLTDAVFEKPGDTFFTGMYTGIVPLGETRIYRTEEVEDFWDIVGRNTNYAADPEEIMADNFSFAVEKLDNPEAAYKNPEILEGILEYLKQ